MQTLATLKKHLSDIVFAFGHHPGKNREDAAYVFIGPPEEVAPGVFHVYSVANSVTFICDDRLLQVDCQLGFKAPEAISAMRKHTHLPVDSIVVTHGHVDHCLGVAHYIQDNIDRGFARPRVIGHHSLRERIDKNKLLEGHRIATDKRQFQVDFDLRDIFVYPDTELHDRMILSLRSKRFLVAHGHGHTEDSVWVFDFDRRVLACGDLFQWTAPNLGNPFKMQRFALENARACEEMAALGADVLCPGHGPVIYGRDEIRECLSTTARYLHFIQDHVVACLNKSMILEDTINSLKLPDELLNSKWLPPVYGHPVFVARGIYKRYAGYYSGRPAELFPPNYADLGREITRLAGGADAILRRVERLQEEGRIELACQLAEWLVEAAPEKGEAWGLYGLLFMERAKSEVNVQARGCWNSAVRRAVANLDRIEMQS
jgi:glyoxylase-like metal-dependent hydrolase (beta-lactamase superfamily II)